MLIKKSQFTAKNTVGDFGIWSGENLDIENSTVELGNSYLVSDGTVTFNETMLSSTDTDTTARGDIHIKGGSITANNSDLESFQNIIINGGTLNLKEESDLTGLGQVEITNGTINLEDGEIWSLGNVNIKGGTLNLSNNADISTLYEDLDDIFTDVTKPLASGNINLAGGKVTVNGGDVYFKSEGLINVSQSALLNIEENSTLYAISKNDISSVGTISLTDAGVVNLNGTLVANIIGDDRGLINFENANAFIDGNVDTPSLVKEFVKDDSLVVVVPNAQHNKGWESIYPMIWAEN